MGWIAGILGAIVAIVIMLLVNGKMKFWRLVNRYPLVAYGFFEDNPEVFFIEDGEEDAPVDRNKYPAGPFYVAFQGMRMTV